MNENLNGEEHSFRWVKIPDKPAPTKVKLWEVPDTSAKFAGKTVTITSMADYEYIELTWRAYRTLSTEYTVLVPVTEFRGLNASSANYGARLLIAGKVPNQADQFIRYWQYVSDTSVKFTDSSTPSGSSSNNNACFPLYLKGVNF